MNLSDGLTFYRGRDPAYWPLTLETEEAAGQVLIFLETCRDHPTPTALIKATDLLILIEKWKAMCFNDRMGNAQENADQSSVGCLSRNTRQE